MELTLEVERHGAVWANLKEQLSQSEESHATQLANIQHQLNQSEDNLREKTIEANRLMAAMVELKVKRVNDINAEKELLNLTKKELKEAKDREKEVTSKLESTKEELEKVKDEKNELEVKVCSLRANSSQKGMKALIKKDDAKKGKQEKPKAIVEVIEEQKINVKPTAPPVEVAGSSHITSPPTTCNAKNS